VDSVGVRKPVVVEHFGCGTGEAGRTTDCSWEWDQTAQDKTVGFSMSIWKAAQQQETLPLDTADTLAAGDNLAAYGSYDTSGIPLQMSVSHDNLWRCVLNGCTCDNGLVHVETMSV